MRFVAKMQLHDTQRSFGQNQGQGARLWSQYIYAFRLTQRLNISIKVHFKDSNGELVKTIEGSEDDTLLDLAHEYDVDLEGELQKQVALSYRD